MTIAKDKWMKYKGTSGVQIMSNSGSASAGSTIPSARPSCLPSRLAVSTGWHICSAYSR